MLPCGVDVGNALESGHYPHSLKMGWIDFFLPPTTGRCQSQSLHLEWEGQKEGEMAGTRGLGKGPELSEGLEVGEQDGKGVKVGTWMELGVGVRIRRT